MCSHHFRHNQRGKLIRGLVEGGEPALIRLNHQARIEVVDFAMAPYHICGKKGGRNFPVAQTCVTRGTVITENCIKLNDSGRGGMIKLHTRRKKIRSSSQSHTKAPFETKVKKGMVKEVGNPAEKVVTYSKEHSAINTLKSL